MEAGKGVNSEPSADQPLLLLFWALLVTQTVKNLSAIQETQFQSLGQEDSPWERKWQLTPVFLPRQFHGQRCLVDYSPWGHKELDMTERLTLSRTILLLQPLISRHLPLSFPKLLQRDGSAGSLLHTNLQVGKVCVKMPACIRMSYHMLVRVSGVHCHGNAFVLSCTLLHSTVQSTVIQYLYFKSSMSGSKCKSSSHVAGTAKRHRMVMMERKVKGIERVE